MKKTLALLFTAGLASTAMAQRIDELNPSARLFPTNEHAQVHEFAGGGGGGPALSYHGGPTITSAKAFPIFWGASWGTGGADAANANTIIAFLGNFGTSPQYNTITQYSGIKTSVLNTGGAWFDASYPTAANHGVSDTDVQNEVVKYLTTMHVTPNASTIYEVFIPNGYYSYFSSSQTSCGGPALAFCAYHSSFTYGGVDVKYSSMPYPSCSGCQASGSYTGGHTWTTAQNIEMFVGHETREAVTDEDGNAWYDPRGYEADDKCAWKSLFTVPSAYSGTAYAYQPEWSNAIGGCSQAN
jgi:hypothetical protein